MTMSVPRLGQDDIRETCCCGFRSYSERAPPYFNFSLALGWFEIVLGVGEGPTKNAPTIPSVIPSWIRHTIPVMAVHWNRVCGSDAPHVPRNMR